ncbi:hypothetical protein [Phytomonospora endophytica]|uniref:Uncharacterized protein n=1 Tax=Phytomonospora endophytica TaxID=714109 RepID=A0A841FGS9_9ACTN|nr:hypothetical protein [Phytomonospora endophytica]MBB6035074.1 hypothetical protein [Phytomonospora endophytica]GIG64177.1 hypothetical protein Pen01_04720 [Phytomonospora endophytica]
MKLAVPPKPDAARATGPTAERAGLVSRAALVNIATTSAGRGPNRHRGLPGARSRAVRERGVPIPGS